MNNFTNYKKFILSATQCKENGMLSNTYKDKSEEIYCWSYEQENLSSVLVAGDSDGPFEVLVKEMKNFLEQHVLYFNKMFLFFNGESELEDYQNMTFEDIRGDLSNNHIEFCILDHTDPQRWSIDISDLAVTYGALFINRDPVESWISD